MAFSYVGDPGRRLVIGRPESPPTIEDWEDLLDRVASDPLFQPGVNLLSDRRTGKSSQMHHTCAHP